MSEDSNESNYCIPIKPDGTVTASVVAPTCYADKKRRAIKKNPKTIADEDSDDGNAGSVVSTNKKSIAPRSTGSASKQNKKMTGDSSEDSDDGNAGSVVVTNKKSLARSTGSAGKQNKRKIADETPNKKRPARSAGAEGSSNLSYSQTSRILFT